MKKGYWYNTIYGRRFKSNEEENTENGVIVVIGLVITVIYLLYR